MSKAGKTKAPVSKTPPSRAVTVRMARTLAQAKASTTKWILCPWQSRFCAQNGLWLSVLAAHDANGALLEALPPSKKNFRNVYAAVFAVDVLRTPAQLIGAIKQAGVGGVINLPSVSFIDGEAGTVLDSLSLGVERELDFLETCAKNDLRIAGIVSSAKSAKRLLNLGVDFLIAHDGPPVRSQKTPDKTFMVKFAGLAQSKSVPVISMPQLL